MEQKSYRGVRDKFLHNEMARDIMNEYRFCKIAGTMYIWNGKHYTPNVEEIIKAIAYQLEPDASTSQYAEVWEKCKQLITPTPFKGCEITLPEFNDVDPYRIAFNNGILNLFDMKFETTDGWKYPICNYIPRDYKPDAPEVPEVTKIIREWANNDDAVEKLLWEVIGFPMLVDCNLKTIFFLYGDGDCGKSTFAKYMQDLYTNSNFTSFDISEINNRFNKAQACNKLFNFGDEINSGYIKEPNFLKRLNSGLPMQCEKKGQDGYQAPFYSKLIFAMNDFPKIKIEGNMDAWERINIIAFRNKFKKTASFKEEIGKKIYTEEAFEYVVRRSAEAIHKVIERGHFDHRDPELFKEFMGNNEPMMCYALDKTFEDWNKFKNSNDMADPKYWWDHAKGEYKYQGSWDSFWKKFNRQSTKFKIYRTTSRKKGSKKENIWAIEEK